MATRFLALIALLSIGIGLTLGVLAVSLIKGRPSAVKPQVQLAPAEQDDLIIMVAEAYSNDHSLKLAQQRLARLHDKHLLEHVEHLANDYAPQRDVVALRLATMAVALGSEDIRLIALNVTPTRIPASALTPTAARMDVTAAALTPAPAQLAQVIVVVGAESGTGVAQASAPQQMPADTRQQTTGSSSQQTSHGNSSQLANSASSQSQTSGVQPPANITPVALANSAQQPTPNAAPAPVTPPPQVAVVVKPANETAQAQAPVAQTPASQPNRAQKTSTPTAAFKATQIALAPQKSRTPAAKASATVVVAAAGPASVAGPIKLPGKRLTPELKAAIVSTLSVKLPDYVGAPAASIGLTARPKNCTPADQMPNVVKHTLALCAGQTYSAFRVEGENITVFGDPDGSARIRGEARGFGITATGNNISIVGVHVEATTDAADRNKWLCLYEACNGGVAYGGGILLKDATNSAVTSSSVVSGTIGVAVSGGSNNKVVRNTLSNLNGWGIFTYSTRGNYIVENTLQHINRACVGPNGAYHPVGCESAAVVSIASPANVFVSNHCDHSSNCYYANGEGGLASNGGKYYNNYCAAATNNCFEITFSTGNQLDYNVATFDPNTHEGCDYPFWISGSVIRFGAHNDWTCGKNDARKSFEDSKKGTNVPTEIQPF